MKKAFPVLIVLMSIFLSSCSEIEIAELNERLIIEAIGIDYEDGKYKVTIEGLDSFTAGSEGNSVSSGQLTKCYLFEGETIGMAMNSISQITGQLPLFSQARVLVIGLETAENKLCEALDFFRREYTTRTDILIAVAEKTARETVSADFGENVSAGNIFEASLSSYKHTGKCPYMPLYRFLNSYMGETDCACCPLIGIKDNAFSDEKEVALMGTAVFRKNGEILKLSPEKTLAYMIMNNETENGDITVTTDKGICTFEIIDCKTVTKVKDEGKFRNIATEVSLRCDIPEFQSPEFRGLSKEDTEYTAACAAKKISGLLTEVIGEVYFRENCDIFNIGRKINLSDPDFYTNVLMKSDSFSECVSFSIRVNVSVRRIGKVILEED